MRVLLIGSGGREHALAWALSASPLLTKLFAAPGNAGICGIAECVTLDPADHAAVVAFCRGGDNRPRRRRPEAPLVAGLVDDLEAAGIRAFGPSKAAAELEGSKGFTKDLCREAGIPTAAYRRFTDRDAARDYVGRHALPVVVKADGLAAGKGVTVATDARQALSALDAIFAAAGRFGRRSRNSSTARRRASSRCATGEPSSLSARRRTTSAPSTATRGRTPAAWAPIRPRRSSTEAMSERVMAEIVRPTVAALGATRHPLSRRALCRADDRRRGAKAHRIQRPLRRSGMPGADAAAEGRSPDHSERRS